MRSAEGPKEGEREREKECYREHDYLPSLFNNIIVLIILYVCTVITYSNSMDEPDKVANPARGQLNRENEYFPVRVRS